jgi:hypothetical protein
MPPDNTDEKQGGGLFLPGQSGNPNGRPRGSRNAATLALEALLDGEAESLTRKAVELALAGDIAALRLCLDRILPPRKDRTVSFALPAMKSSGDAVAAMAALADAVAAGDLAPSEAAELTKMVQAFAKVIETADLEERIKRLEGMAAK